MSDWQDWVGSWIAKSGVERVAQALEYLEFSVMEFEIMELYKITTEMKVDEKLWGQRPGALHIEEKTEEDPVKTQKKEESRWSGG